MKRMIFLLIALSLTMGLAAQVLSCYDIQFTESPDGNSPYANQSVTIQAIVTAVNRGSSFYIGDASGGPWSGLYIFDRTNSNTVNLGDEIRISGSVSEYKQADYWPSALTELVSVSSCEILSTSNPLPPATPLSTSQLPMAGITSEQWEGVLVRFTDVQIKSSPDSYGQFKIADSSNSQAMVDDGFFAVANNFQIIVNDMWYQIQGIVDFHGSSSAGYKINPRFADDLRKVDSVEYSVVTVQNTNTLINTQAEVNVTTTKVKPAWGVQSYTINLRLDPTQVIFHGLSIDGTLTPYLPTTTVSANGDSISFTVVYQEMLAANDDDMVLIKLLIEPLSYGESVIEILSFKYDNVDVTSLNDGKILTRIQGNFA
ncbi:MAG: hypothetical protein PHO32_03995, partial [Candidatus Cloacimonetes bacterium]|nr:hypothetical protein [Candidatus Cloacimonadota bacterium]